MSIRKEDLFVEDDLELGARSRNDAEKEQRKQQILHAALAEFQVNGFDRTTISSIARRAGQSRTLVNFYFTDKSGLYSALEQMALEELASRFEDAAKSAEEGAAKLHAFIKAYIQFQGDHPGYFYLLGGWEDEDDRETLSMTSESRNALGYLVEAILEGEKDGTVRPSKTTATERAVMLWAATHGCIQLATKRERIMKAHWSVDPEDMLRNLPESLVRIVGF